MDRKFRLTGDADFQRIRREGRSWAHPWLILCALSNDRAHSRFGFIVSRRFGKATARNRARRLLREAVRLRRPDIAPGWDMVFIARVPLREASFREVNRVVEQLLRRASLMTFPPQQEKS